MQREGGELSFSINEFFLKKKLMIFFTTAIETPPA